MAGQLAHLEHDGNELFLNRDTALAVKLDLEQVTIRNEDSDKEIANKKWNDINNPELWDGEI